MASMSDTGKIKKKEVPKRIHLVTDPLMTEPDSLEQRTKRKEENEQVIMSNQEKVAPVIKAMPMEVDLENAATHNKKGMLGRNPG